MSDVQEFIKLKELDVSSTITIGDVESNGTSTITVSALGPSNPNGIGTATISKWAKVNQGGTTYFIPMWT